MATSSIMQDVFTVTGDKAKEVLYYLDHPEEIPKENCLDSQRLEKLDTEIEETRKETLTTLWSHLRKRHQK